MTSIVCCQVLSTLIAIAAMFSACLAAPLDTFYPTEDTDVVNPQVNSDIRPCHTNALAAMFSACLPAPLDKLYSTEDTDVVNPQVNSHTLYRSFRKQCGMNDQWQVRKRNGRLSTCMIS